MLRLNHLLSVTIAFGRITAYDTNNLLPSSTQLAIVGSIPTSPSAIPARGNHEIGVWTSEVIREMIEQRDEYTSRGDIGSIEQRDQYIFALCPESWAGQSPKACSNCGGDTITRGRCDQIMLTGSQERCTFPGGCGVYCKCISDAKDNNPGRITSVATIDGQAGTVVYEALTLSEYSGLQASTTITITDLVATSTDSSADMETFVAVVVAGGVAWWVAGE